MTRANSTNGMTMETKKRHGCVTAWLIIMIIANAITSVTYLFLDDMITESLPFPIPQSMMLALAAIGTANLIFSVMLFKWKKWAFWGFVGTSLVTFGINISLGLGVTSSLLGLIGVVILFGILQIKKNEVSAWKNLA